MSTGKMAYTVENMASLTGLKVMVSRYVLDNQIVFKGRERQLKPLGVSWALTIWNLDTGEMNGNLDLADATEMHVSPARFKELRDKVIDWEHDKEMERL